MAELINTFILFTLFYTRYHVLFLCKDSEEAVMPLLNVNVQEMGGGEGAATGAANMSVQGVVVVFKLLQSIEDCTATSNMTGKLRHTENEKRKIKEDI